jgi:uncharacterized protein
MPSPHALLGPNGSHSFWMTRSVGASQASSPNCASPATSSSPRFRGSVSYHLAPVALGEAGSSSTRLTGSSDSPPHESAKTKAENAPRQRKKSARYSRVPAITTELSRRDRTRTPHQCDSALTMLRDSVPTLRRSRRLVKLHAVTLSVISVLVGCGTRNSATTEVPSSPEPAANAARQPATLAPIVPAEEPRCVVPMKVARAASRGNEGECPEAPSPLPELGTRELRFPDAPKAPPLVVDHAEEDAQRRVGLMYRATLDENRGMLFSWADERPRSFWMRNTCIPLDLLFIDRQGFIVGILEQVPTLNDEPRRVPCPAARVLEVNAGFCRKHGIQPGQRVLLVPATEANPSASDNRQRTDE